MTQWKSTDNADSAPLYTVDATTGRSGKQEYGNTVFGYTPAEKTAVSEGLASPGWVRVVKGKGSLTGIVVVAGGTGYANTDTIAYGNTSGTLITNGSGVVTGANIAISNTLVDTVPTLTITTAAGTGANLAFTTSGRIGRKQSETLVAMRNIQ